MCVQRVQRSAGATESLHYYIQISRHPQSMYANSNCFDQTAWVRKLISVTSYPMILPDLLLVTGCHAVRSKKILYMCGRCMEATFCDRFFFRKKILYISHMIIITCAQECKIFSSLVLMIFKTDTDIWCFYTTDTI